MAGGKNSKSEGLIYRGRPLRRAGNMIYYGTMTDQYIIMMQVLETKKRTGSGCCDKGLRSAPAYRSRSEKP